MILLHLKTGNSKAMISCIFNPGFCYNPHQQRFKRYRTKPSSKILEVFPAEFFSALLSIKRRLLRSTVPRTISLFIEKICLLQLRESCCQSSTRMTE